MRALHHAISVSHATSQDWIERCGLGDAYSQRVTVIHNGIRAERIVRSREKSVAKKAYGLPQDAIVAGSLGRLVPAKGYEYFIRAMPEVLRSNPKVHAVIGGTGSVENELKELSRALGVEQAVTFPGFIADPASFLEAIDIFVHPALSEAQGIVLLE